MAGYSGTPLAKKLGIVPGSRVVALAAPMDYEALLAPVPEGVRFGRTPGVQTDVAHAFVRDRATLAHVLSQCRDTMRPDASLWVSWPKKASRIPTDVTEDVVRELALPLGWVDIKVCAVDDTWSGLKLVVRKASR